MFDNMVHAVDVDIQLGVIWLDNNLDLVRYTMRLIASYTSPVVDLLYSLSNAFSVI